MKILTATLEAAQHSAHRLPYLEAEIKDLEQGIGRLRWERAYTGSEPDSHHGIAVDGNGDIHRIRVVGTTLYRQHIVSPGAHIPLTPWTTVTNDCAGPCAIAAYGARIYIFYRRDTVNELAYIRSHDYGATWPVHAVFRAYTDVISMAACFWAAGPNVICFTLRTNEMTAIVWDTDTDTFVRQRTVTFTPPYPYTITNTFGIGATYSSRRVQCQIVLAGLQSDTPYNHYNVYRSTLSATHYFSEIESFAMVPDDPITPGLVKYEYPDCHFPILSPQDYEETRITLVEKYSGVDAYDRPMTCHVVKDTHFTDTAFTEPRPFVDVSSDYGLRLASDATHWWMSRPDGIWRAPRTPLADIDISGDIMSLKLQAGVIASPDLSGRGNLVIELDNSEGQYADPGAGALASLRFRAEIQLRLGYRTTLLPAGEETVDTGTFWIDSWQYSSTPGRSLFTIHCLDGWGLARAWTAQHQLRWNGPGATPHEVWAILYMILARFGIRLRDGAWPRSNPMLNFYPDFTLAPGTRGDTAIRRLLSMVPDRLVFLGQDAFVKDPRSTEASCYSYAAPAIASPTAGHAIFQGTYGEAATASRARALGRDATNDPVIADVFDWDLQQLYDYLEADYDPNLATLAEAEHRANALLRTAALGATPATLLIPANVGQEPLDVVDVTDPRCGITAQNFRVHSIVTDYDRTRARYHQTLTLGAP
ncbi:MAG: hypothetical protein R6V59_01670 [Dehalococcoidia bacterium]